MTNGVANRRRRASVSLSMPDTGGDPIDELIRVTETLLQVNRVLARTVVGRQELMTLGGILAQVSGALLTLTDLLGAPAERHGRSHLNRADTGATPGPPAATRSLQHCRDGILAAYTSAQAFHADLRRWRPAGSATN